MLPCHLVTTGLSAARADCPLVMTAAPRGKAGLAISTHSVVCTPGVTCTSLARPFSVLIRETPRKAILYGVCGRT